MILKGNLCLNKKNLPPYVFWFNVALVVFIATWIAAYFISTLAVAHIYGDDAVYIVLAVAVAVFFVALGAFYAVALILRKRLINERTADIEEEFIDMPLDTATEILKERSLITENGFIIKDDILGKRVIPFGDAKFLIQYKAYEDKSKGHMVQKVPRVTEIEVLCCIFARGEYGQIKCSDTIKFDVALFNFIDKRNLIDYNCNKEAFLLKTDKKNFARAALGFKLK